MDQYVLSMVCSFISTEVRRCFATHFQECKIRLKLQFVSILSISFLGSQVSQKSLNSTVYE